MNDRNIAATAETARANPSTGRLVENIERTRAELSSTISTLESRLSPEKVGAELEQVENKIREAIREHLAEAKTLVQEELVEAKGALRAEMNEAETKIRRGLADARDALKSDLRDEWTTVETKLKDGLSEARDAVKKNLREVVTDAKTSIRAATLGKVENFATDLGDTMNDTRDTLLDTIRQNPLPAALAGLGVAWLFMNRSKAASARTRSRGFVDPRGVPYDEHGDGRSAVGNAVHHASDVANRLMHGASEAGSGVVHHVSEAAGATLHGASDLAGRIAAQTAETGGAVAHGVADASTQLAHRVNDAAAYVGSHARTEARSVERAISTTLHESPLAFGVAAIAAGAAIGFALPRTQGEDRIMGDSRDAVVRRAGSAVHDAAILVGHIGEKTAESAKQLLSDSPPGHR
jgi:hypothetical protein